MRNSFTKLVAPSLLIGCVITTLFIAQMDWKNIGECSENYQGQTLSVRRVDCSSLEYGYPLHFIHSEPKVYISTLSESREAPALVGVSSVIKLDKAKLATNLVIWSAVSFVLLLVISQKVVRKK